MLFSSIPFLFYFLPVVLIVYFLVPYSLKNTVLLISSLFFYGWGESKYVFLMLLVIAAGYILGLFIGKYREQKLGKLFLGLTVVIDIAVLGYFKYADFFISNFNAATGMQMPLLKIALPIGISFFIFQILSYDIDVYRGQVAVQKNPITLAAYVAMFPQLIAGPIVRYIDVEKQLRKREHSLELAADGIRRFMIGLGKKILLANLLGECCAVFKESSEKTILFFWIYGIAYMLHIYFDFSGYSDMAIGLGKIFGFHFMENFNYPYISKSITEFWRRWHISLGSWFRDYVYIPLGGNRVSKGRWIFNIFMVWFLTGFWHGAAWNFIIWGLYFVVFLLMEKFWLGKYINRAKVWNHIYVLFFIMISFMIFDATSIQEAGKNIAGLFGIGTTGFASMESIYYLKNYLLIFLLAMIGATPLPKKIYEKITNDWVGRKVVNVIEPLLLAGLFLIITAFLVDGSFNPFLYFRF
ncbi:MAG: MBOAT family protein [Lachnospiraceae bacterium]|nr:MBOAT family protein [Lachnospiraceae bacterium]